MWRVRPNLFDHKLGEVEVCYEHEHHERCRQKAIEVAELTHRYVQLEIKAKWHAWMR